MDKYKTVYFAGELFSLKHLTGNAILGDAIERASKGSYKIILPQNIEITPKHRGKEIRDLDLAALLSADCGVFSFDGQELDSGTLVEFLFAKFADIPSVLVRTDFRNSGDNKEVPWNLMACSYPRTKTLKLSAMELYAGCFHKTKNSVEACAVSNNKLAVKIVRALDKIVSTPPIAKKADAKFLKNWIVQCADIGGVSANLVRKAILARAKQYSR